MLKKISKIMWIGILALFVLGMIVAAINGNSSIAELTGKLIAYALVIQLGLWGIGYFTKDKVE